MFCTQCGQRITLESGRCPVCGAAIGGASEASGECPSCQAPRAPEDLYCRRCGALLPLDLGALDQFEASEQSPFSEEELPDWLRSEQPVNAESGSAFLSEADLPDWLREPIPPTAVPAPSPPVGGELSIPAVSPAWYQPSASEAADPRLFEPLLPLVLVPSFPTNGTHATTAAAEESGERRRIERLFLLAALVILIGIVVYIVWMSR